MSNPPDPHRPGHPQQPGPQQNSPQPSGPQHPQPSGQTQWSPQYAAPQYAGQPGQPQPGQPQPGQPQWGPQPPAGPGGYPGMHPGQKPPKQKKPLLKRWWFWLLVVLVVIIFFSAISGGGGDSTEDTGASSSQGAEEQPADEAPAEDAPAEEAPAEEAAAEYGIGDAVTADGWEITVNEVEDGVSSVGSEYLNTEAQGQFVTVSLSVANTTNEPAFFFEDNIKLGDEKGNTYSSDSEAGMYVDENSILFLEEINPGNTAEGVLVFDVPKDVTPDRLIFEGGIFSDPVEISLK